MYLRTAHPAARVEATAEEWAETVAAKKVAEVMAAGIVADDVVAG